MLTAFFFRYHAADPFKPGEHVVTSNIVLLCYFIYHVGSYNRFYHHIIFPGNALCFAGFYHIIKSKHRCLVAVKQNPFAFIIFYANP